jgi:cytochrome c oxidase cbb3-type subunit IV
MKPDQLITSFVSDLVLTWWTPLFVAVFIAVVAYALWPRNGKSFDAAARMPLRED